MALPTFTMRQLLEAGVHFGHRTRRWNPKMAPYLFGVRNDIHVIDLQQTVPLLHRAMVAVRDIVAGGGRVLFVGTKRQASDHIAEAAKRCGQYYVNHRWLGGMMTNWRTISNSIKRLHEVEAQLVAEDSGGLTKKETLRLHREQARLDRALGGIKEMGGLPDVLFVIDTNREDIAVAEANKIGIPVVAVVDSNSDPSGIDFPIPGNDDAIRAVHMYCDLVAGAVLDGIQAEVTASGGDLGEGDETPAEALPSEDTDAGAQGEDGKAPPDARAKSEEQEPAEPAIDDAAVPQGKEKEAAPPPDEPEATPPQESAEAAPAEPATDDAVVPEGKEAAPSPDEPEATPPQESAEAAAAEPATDDAAVPEGKEAAPPQELPAQEPAREKEAAAEDAAGAAAKSEEQASADGKAPSGEESAAEAAPGGETDKTKS